MGLTKLRFRIRARMTLLLVTVLLAAVMTMSEFLTSTAQTSIVVNGGFEQPDIAGAAFATQNAGTTFGNWTVESGSVDIVGSTWVPAEGKQSVDLSGADAGTIFQDLATTPGVTYRLSFSMAGNVTGLPVLKQMEVIFGTTSLGNFSFDTTSHTTQNMGWQTVERNVVAATSTTRLRFRSLTPGAFGMALDNVSAVAITGQATPTPVPTPIGTACPANAPFFPETGFCIDNPAIQAYFQARGGVDTFGFPVSRTFRLLGFPAQVFQRHVLRVHPDGVKPMNLLDPDVLPVTAINFATFPAHNPALAASAPPPNTPNYGQAVLAHLQANVPDTFEGLSVQFLQAYLSAGQEAARVGDFPALVALEIWGFPTSSPARDPNNSNFVYQRFQRGILHSFPNPTNPASRVTRGILLADYLKFVITNDPVLLPADLRAQVQTSRYFNQHCPNNPGWICRPAELPDSDLTAAFEKQQG